MLIKATVYPVAFFYGTDCEICTIIWEKGCGALPHARGVFAAVSGEGIIQSGIIAFPSFRLFSLSLVEVSILLRTVSSPCSVPPSRFLVERFCQFRFLWRKLGACLPIRGKMSRVRFPGCCSEISRKGVRDEKANDARSDHGGNTLFSRVGRC